MWSTGTKNILHKAQVKKWSWSYTKINTYQELMRPGPSERPPVLVSSIHVIRLIYDPVDSTKCTTATKNFTPAIRSKFLPGSQNLPCANSDRSLALHVLHNILSRATSKNDANMFSGTDIICIVRQIRCAIHAVLLCSWCAMLSMHIIITFQHAATFHFAVFVFWAHSCACNIDSRFDCPFIAGVRAFCDRENGSGVDTTK